MDGRTGENEEGNIRFSQFCERLKKKKKKVAKVAVCTKSALPFSYMLPLRLLAAASCSRISLSICPFVYVLDTSPLPFHALTPQLSFAILPRKLCSFVGQYATLASLLQQTGISQYRTVRSVCLWVPLLLSLSSSHVVCTFLPCTC